MEKENITRNQHYVPQFYLKEFADERGYLYVYNIKYDKIEYKTPKQICFEKNLYEIPLQYKNSACKDYIFQNFIENEFSKEEKEYSSLLKRIKKVCHINQSENALILEPEEKLSLMYFVTNLLIRNPDNFMRTKKFWTDSENYTEESVKLTTNMIKEMGIIDTKPFFDFFCLNQALFRNGGTSFDYMIESLQEQKLMFYYAEEGEFLSTNLPVLAEYKADDGEFKNMDNPVWEEFVGKSELDNKKSYIHFPLTPKIMVFIADPNFLHIESNRMRVVTKKYVDYCNREMVFRNFKAHKYVFGKSKKQIEKMANIIKSVK